VALARQAGSLRHRAVLAGWLHGTARNIAVQTVRTDARRRRREQEAFVMRELLGQESIPRWEEIAPHLDAMLGDLAEADREVVLLRYFEKKTAAEIAQIIGGTDEAVHKRTQRAVERLREMFARRGIAVVAGGLAAAIAANSVQAAPTGMGAAFATAALAGAMTPAAPGIAVVAKTIAMTTAQKLIVAATVAVLAGAGIYQASQAAHVRRQNLSLEQQQTALQEQVEQLRREPPAAAVRAATAPANDNTELLRLRGEVASLRQQVSAAAEKSRAGQNPAADGQSEARPEDGAPEGKKEEGPIIDAEVVDEKKAA